MNAASKKPRISDAEPANYEQALAELEQLVDAMESGSLPLENLLAHHKRGAQLLSFCRERLAAVENQVKLLEEGQLKDWTGIERG